MTTVLAILGSMATIISALVYAGKLLAYKTQKTTEQTDEDIDSQVESEQDNFEKTGRP